MHAFREKNIFLTEIASIVVQIAEISQWYEVNSRNAIKKEELQAKARLIICPTYLFFCLFPMIMFRAFQKYLM